MANTFFGLTIGTTGLYASNVGINTTSHNISNTESEGYSRQLVHSQAASALRTGNATGMIGTGVDVTGVRQERNIYYDEKYWKNSTFSGFYSTREYYMDNIENYFNEVQLEGFTTTFNQMNDALQELTKNASDLTVRTEVTSYAESLCEYFQFMSSSMLSIQEDINFEIKNQVDSMNSIGTQIAGLTKQINSIELTGEYANDLRDQRALLVDRLSKIADISISEEKAGAAELGVTSYTVRVGDRKLVDTYIVNTMKVEAREESVNMSDLDGLYEVKWSDGQNFNALTGGGTLQALFEMRDGNNQAAFQGITSAGFAENVITVTDTNVNSVNKLNIPFDGYLTIGNREYKYNGFQVSLNDEGLYEYEFELDEELRENMDDTPVVVGKSISYKGIPYYMAQINEFMRTYAKSFNDLHKQGIDLNGDAGLDFFNAADKVTGENYVFETAPDHENEGILFNSRSGIYAEELYDEEGNVVNYGSYYLMTAANCGVTKAVYADPNLVAPSSSITDGVEENDIATALAALKDDKKLFSQGAPEDYLQTLIAELGIDSHKAEQFAKNQDNIVKAIVNQRLSVSGVDTEEEAMNLIRYQNTYNLSAKVISTMDEMYDRLINYMGV